MVLIGRRGGFDKATGSGVGRYMYELDKRLKAQKGLSVHRFEPSTAALGSGMSLVINTTLTDFSNYDIIHKLNVYPAIPLRKSKAIVITTLHDYAVTKSMRLLTRLNFGHNLWTKLGLELSLLSSDYMIANSTQTRDEMIKDGYDRNRVFAVDLGIDDRFISGIPSKKNKKFVVGWMGNYGGEENTEFMLRLSNYLTDDFILEVWGPEAGRGAYDEKGMAMVEKHAKKIMVMGFAPEGKIVETYDGFDAYINTSGVESFGLSIIEAQARGLPVIIYKHARISREVRRYCFEAEDVRHMALILQDLKNNGYNEKLRKRAKEYARSFTWGKTTRETLDIYRKVLERD